MARSVVQLKSKFSRYFLLLNRTVAGVYDQFSLIVTMVLTIVLTVVLTIVLTVVLTIVLTVVLTLVFTLVFAISVSLPSTYYHP